jgi:hypothetical protein
MVGTLMAFSPLGVFTEASLLVKLVLVIILGAGVIALVTAIARRMSNGPRSSLLALLGRVGLYTGVGGAGYEAMTTYMTASQMHVTRFVIVEPEVIEAVFVLLSGVIVYVIARLGNAGRV